jgi:16S rRNA (cytosine1407-C5)-methyltransferase
MTQAGQRAFEEHYTKMCAGICEPATLFAALQHKSKPIIRVIPHHAERLRALWQAQGLTILPLSWYELAWEWPPEIPFGTVLPGLKEKWLFVMNRSSLLPVLALQPGAGDLVLDACAAPGGKALFIADLLGEYGHLVANDLSRLRRARMKSLLHEYGHDRPEVWSRPAEEIFTQYPNHFDAILLDAPCSSEKHIYMTPKELTKWTPQRIVQLSHRQQGLLYAVWQALKPGGRLVYSTCAIAPQENEGVLATFLAHQTDAVLDDTWLQQAKAKDTDFPGEAGMAGEYQLDVDKVRRVWPDDIHDPMFISVLRKV